MDDRVNAWTGRLVGLKGAPERDTELPSVSLDAITSGSCQNWHTQGSLEAVHGVTDCIASCSFHILVFLNEVDAVRLNIYVSLLDRPCLLLLLYRTRHPGILDPRDRVAGRSECLKAYGRFDAFSALGLESLEILCWLARIEALSVSLSALDALQYTNRTYSM